MKNWRWLKTNKQKPTKQIDNKPTQKSPTCIYFCKIPVKLVAKLFCSMTSLGPAKWALTGIFTASIISYLPPSFSDFGQQTDVNALNHPLQMPLKPSRLTPNMGMNTTYLCKAFSCSLTWALKQWKTHQCPTWKQIAVDLKRSWGG